MAAIRLARQRIAPRRTPRPPLRRHGAHPARSANEQPWWRGIGLNGRTAPICFTDLCWSCDRNMRHADDDTLCRECRRDVDRTYADLPGATA